MNPYLRTLCATAIGVAIGVALAFAIAAMPWRWLQLATVLVLLAAVAVWNVRQLRWIRRQRREMAAEYARLMAMIREDR